MATLFRTSDGDKFAYRGRFRFVVVRIPGLGAANPAPRVEYRTDDRTRAEKKATSLRNHYGIRTHGVRFEVIDTGRGA